MYYHYFYSKKQAELAGEILVEIYNPEVGIQQIYATEATNKSNWDDAVYLGVGKFVKRVSWGTMGEPNIWI